MAEKNYDVFEKYDFTVNDTKKGRGVIIADTDKGPKVLAEYTGSGNFVECTAKILDAIDIKTDNYIKNKEGAYISTGSDGVRYVVKEWYACRDCDIKSFGDITASMRMLAKLHNELLNFSHTFFKYEGANPRDEMKKKNNEIYRVRKYLCRKNNRNEFEMLAYRHCEKFIKEGDAAIRAMENFNDIDMVTKGICHGNYNYHNICFMGSECIIINFRKMHYDYLMMDVYHIMRKILEKYDWDIKLGHKLLSEYDSVRPLNEAQVTFLGIMFSYPEKFWKIINSYNNSRKTRMFNKNCEKLSKIVAQNEKRWEFIRTLWYN